MGKQVNSKSSTTMKVQTAKGGFNKDYGPAAKPHKVTASPKKG